MKQNIRDVMTPNPKAVAQSATIMEAACVMRDNDIGDVVVLDNGCLCGILTDRDIVVRALAVGRDPNRTSVGEVCSRALLTLAPEDSTGQAVRVMREHAIRRLPIEEDGRVVGIVTLGDVAVDADRRSALADISAAPPNV
jgi:CBS domain-containing protein